MQNNISYSGKVTIRTNNNSPIKKHNAGTLVLFKTLCEVLSSSVSNDSTVLPSSISIIHDANGLITESILTTDTNYNNYSKGYILSSPAPIGSREVLYTGNTYSCKLVSFVPNSLLLSSTSNLSTTTKTYILMLNSKKQILAYVSGNFGELIGLRDDAAGQAAIEWEMSFDNKQEIES